MNKDIKPHETNPNKIIVDIYSDFIDELYKKSGICQEQTNSEADENDPGTYMDD